MKINIYLLLRISLCFILIPEITTAQNKSIKISPEIAYQKKLRTIVEANPENIKAHQAFIKSFKQNDPSLDMQYKIWINRFPKSFIIPFEIGRAYAMQGNPKAKEYLLKTVKLKPDLAEAWYFLGSDAAGAGDYLTAGDLFAKAIKANPKKAEYRFSYAYSFRNSEHSKYDSLMLDVAFRFVNTDIGAIALVNLASNAESQSEKIAYYEQLYKRYIKLPTNEALIGMEWYFDLLLNTEPEKAFNLALTIAFETSKAQPSWAYRVNVSRNILHSKYLLKNNKYFEANEVLKKIELKNILYAVSIDAEETLLLLKAEVADAMSQTKAAYDSLVIYYSKKPSDKLYEAIISYAKKLEIDQNQVNCEIKNLRQQGAELATDFSLEQYLTEEKISLSDFKGKVVLLTYWFPGCWPCRIEFPHFETVIKRFNNQEVAYLAINTEKSQDDYVVPYMKSNGYSFIPLRDQPRDRGNLPAPGVPKNYLIDQQGRIIFSNFRINKNNERMLELMISELLSYSDSETTQ